ncbi:MAG: YggT family protein [Bdellovibrionota bacterium]
MPLIDIFLTLAHYLLQIYSLCLVVAGVLSFVGANPNNGFVVFFRAITAPPCRMLTQKFPKLIIRTGNGFLDLSPIVLLLILGCLMIIIEKVAFYLKIYL